MMNTNELTLCRSNYKDEQEFTNAIATAVKLLLDAEYIMTVRYDEPGLGIVCIEYEHADERMGSPYPVWLTCEERDLVYSDRCDKEKENG